MNEWENSGCEVCRHQWETGARPRELATNLMMHSRLYRCDVCGTYWEEEERAAHAITEQVALEHFPSFAQHEKQNHASVLELEQAIREAKDGAITIPAMLAVLLKSTLALPSASEINADGSGILPLQFNKEGVQMVACFSNKDRIGDFKSKVPFCLEINGLELLRRIPSGFGLVINPGSEAGFEISPEGIKRLMQS